MRSNCRSTTHQLGKHGPTQKQATLATWRAGVRHLGIAAELYGMQLSAGRYVVHEHPLSASSRAVPEIVQAMHKPDRKRYSHEPEVGGCKWVEPLKMDEYEPKHRRRCVAHETNTCDNGSIFEGTTPLEPKTALVSMAVPDAAGPGAAKQTGQTKLRFWAFDEHTSMPRCTSHLREATKRGRVPSDCLSKAQAVNAWHERCCEQLGAQTLITPSCPRTCSGGVNPGVLQHTVRDVKLVVHGDEFTFS